MKINAMRFFLSQICQLETINSHSRQADSRSASPDIPHILSSPTIYHHFKIFHRVTAVKFVSNQQSLHLSSI